jgi:hypothetical protein
MLFLVSPQLNSQQASTTVQRDSQAVAILQQSVAAMASSSPSDSSATGTVTIVEGSITQSGSIQILTLGTAQTAETLTLPDGLRTVVYSNGLAKETSGTQATNPPLETVVTDQCPDFPLPFLLSALNNPDAAFHYVGMETLNGSAVSHIQLWNSFASKPRLQKLASFSLRDIWIDSTSSLPVRITYTRRPGGGAVPAIPVEIKFSSYTKVSGILYPFQIKKSFNGTPWQTIDIQSVSFNTGLTAAQFQVE